MSKNLENIDKLKNRNSQSALKEAEERRKNKKNKEAVKEIDGHDVSEILEGISWFDTVKDGPAVLVAKTVKGKGISYMENNPAFHGAAPNDEQLEMGLRELGFTD